MINREIPQPYRRMIELSTIMLGSAELLQESLRQKNQQELAAQILMAAQEMAKLCRELVD
jgi:hypothetical protein